MLIKRKTKQTSVPMAHGRVTFYAGPSTVLHAGAVAPSDNPGALVDERHVIDLIGDGAYAIVPEVTIEVPGVGDVVLTPGEVLAVELAIAIARRQCNRGDNFNGRELSRGF